MALSTEIQLTFRRSCHLTPTPSNIIPDWNAPANIKSLVTTRKGGCSQAPFDSFNLGYHVDDNAVCVKQNRQILAKQLPSEPVWLNQVHSDVVVDAAEAGAGIDADGSFTTQNNVVSAVLTADCLPVLMCTRQGDAVAALHAGWRGLANGILEQGVMKLLKASGHKAEDLLVWFGPAIGAEKFAVGDEVREEFLSKSQHKELISRCFTAAENNADKGKWLANIYRLAQYRLSAIGIENFSGGTYCTYNNNDLFYSYRRDGKTGRMASLIWIE